MKCDRVSALTVMRGEWARLPGLLRNLDWVKAHHLVDTSLSSGCPPIPLPARVTLDHYPLPEGAPFDQARNVGVSRASTDWILSVDTDERIPSTLARRIVDGVEGTEWSESTHIAIPRINHILGAPVTHGGVWPDYQWRLIRRQDAVFDDAVHCPVREPRATGRRLEAIAANSILHFSFQDTEEFTARMARYARIRADQSRNSVSIARALLTGASSFAARYIRARGFLDGSRGLHLAIIMSFAKYLEGAMAWERTLTEGDSMERFDLGLASGTRNADETN